MTEKNNSELDIDSDELVENRIIVADPKQSPMRIDKFLMSRVDRLSRSKLQSAIKAGCVLVDGKEVKPNYKIRPNDSINLIIPINPNAEFALAPENIPLDIVYEDRDVLIINKPAGLVVHPGIGNHSGTLVNALMYHLSKELPVMEGNSYDRPGIVHRIDKDTTGLMVIAKNEESMSHLAKQFFNHSIKREYLALVWGDVKEDTGTIEGNIGRHPRERIQMAVFEDGSEGKEAITHYEVVKNLYYVTLVRCWLETGRTHQIRVHMKHIGHTLFNDERYGGDKVLKGTIFSKYKQFVENCFQLIPRQALHARSLGFIHPRTNEEMYFEAPLPEDMQNALEKWESYLNSRKEVLEKE